MRGAATLMALSCALFLAACGSGASVVPTPTPISVLAQQYLTAANKANKADDAVNAGIGQDCKTLDPCKRDFAQYSQIEGAFVAELRVIRVPASMEADLRALLDIERRYISLEDDAAQATSVGQISTDNNLINALGNQHGDAVDHIRLDLGLPSAPRLTPSASPSAAPSASA